MITILTAIAATATLAPYDLRCESFVNPMGLDALTPRLSWKLRATQPNLRALSQRRYRILVASSPDILKQGQGDLWDSGPVETQSTYGIAYSGKPLTSLQRCWWTVKAWDQANQPSDWSPPASWSMGLLKAEDWKSHWISIGAPIYEQQNAFRGASWIWSPTDPDLNAPEVTRVFHKEFVVTDPSSLASAVLHITADDQFDLRLNGKEVHASPKAFEEWKRPVTLDLRPFLKAGVNSFDISAYNASLGPAGLLAQLTLVDAHGGETKVETDGSWTVRDSEGGPAMSAHVVAPYGSQPWGAFAAPELHAATYYRRDFSVDKPIKQATAIVSALGWVDLMLNGKPVYEDLFTPGWTDYFKRVCYRTYDVTDRVKQGENAVGAVLGEGWYAGYIGWARERELYGKTPKVRVQLDIEYADGTHQIVGTDASWKATTGPIVAQSILHGEVYDAREDMPGWDSAGYKDGRWQTPEVSPEIEASLEAFPSEPVLPYAEVKLKRAWKIKPGTYLVDFGQNLAGFARLRVKEPRGTKIVMRFGERLDASGQLYTVNLRSAQATDTFICAGGSEEEWTPRFTFHGFQYAEISGLSHKPTKDDFTAVAISTATPEVGSLQTSDRMLNKLVSNAWWTQKMNFVDVPTDCPQRDERLGWTGDAQAYIRTATFFSDVQRFFTKWLVSLDDGQQPDGMYPTVAPLIVSSKDGGPAWADAGVICPWTIYEVYGDRELLAKHYPQMKRFVEFCRHRSNAEGLQGPDVFGFDDWLNIDAPTPREVIAQAYFAGSTRLLSQSAAALGKNEESDEYAQLYQQLRAAFQKAYVSPDGKVKGETQCAYVLALAFDLLDDTTAQKAANLLVADIEKRGWHLSTGFVGTRDILHVLSKCGRNDVAFRLLHNTTFPSWGFTIVNGATSIWERWDGWTPEHGFQDPGMNSFAHYAYGSVVGWMFANIAGIKDGSPGFDTIRIAPAIDPHLEWAKGRYDSVHGVVRSEWRREGDRLLLKVEVPPNTTAVITVPSTDGVVTASVGATREAGTDFSVGSGSYTFQSTFRH